MTRRTPVTARDWIDALQLERHPEGGWFRETHRTGRIGGCCLDGPRAEGRSVSTAIYYLLEEGDLSRLHRIRSDETWHHYAGGTLIVHTLSEEDGSYGRIVLGDDLVAGERPQGVVPAGCWFGATVVPDGRFTLAGCTVAPGFDFADLEIARRDDLLGRFPHQREVVETLTRP